VLSSPSVLLPSPNPTSNPLLWWSSDTVKAQYPRLHQMALDFLTIPGVLPLCSIRPIAHSRSLATAVSVEREFSRARYVIPYTRNRLSALSIVCWQMGRVGLDSPELLGKSCAMSDPADFDSSEFRARGCSSIPL